MFAAALKAVQVVLAVGIVILSGSNAAAEKRVALVIGNGGYASLPALPNPANDARDVTNLLRTLGFEVLEGTDLDRSGLVTLIGKFLEGARGSDAALVYYAGHGIQYEEDNYLLPVDASVTSAYGLKSEAVSLKGLLGELEGLAKVNLVFLDACRDNPLAERLAATSSTRSSRSLGRGLTRVDPRSANTLIAFAAAPGQVALDGTDRNSPFASAFLREVARSRDEISILFKAIARDVLEATGNAQQPQIVSAMTVNFYFQGGDATVSVTEGASGAQAAYDAAARIGTERAFQAIVDGFPNTVQASLALAAIEQMHQQAAEAKPAAPQSDAASPAATPETSAAPLPPPPPEESQVALLSSQEIEDALNLSREQRQSVQRALERMGHDPGPADGEFGGQTRDALRRYQAALHVGETGFLSQELLNGLDFSEAPGGGSTGHAQRYALADIPEGSDPRLRKAMETLLRYELAYGYHAGHLYLAVLTLGVNWEASKRLAETAGGHLVTIGNRAENDFVYGLFKNDNRFIELAEDHDQKNGPYIGLFQPTGSREPRGGWRWVTDEPLNYTNWTKDQPNNGGGKSDIAWFYSYGNLSPGDEQRPIRWDDAEAEWGSRGFVMEVE